MQLLEVRNLALICCENELARLLEGDVLLFAAGVEEVAATNAKSGLEGVWRIVDTALNGVVSARGRETAEKMREKGRTSG